MYVVVAAVHVRCPIKDVEDDEAEREDDTRHAVDFADAVDSFVVVAAGFPPLPLAVLLVAFDAVPQLVTEAVIVRAVPTASAWLATRRVRVQQTVLTRIDSSIRLFAAAVCRPSF